MGGELLDVDHRQTVPGQRLLRRQQREVREVLVVDGVELDLVHEVEQVGELDAQPPLRFEDQGEAGHEVVEIGDVGEDVVGHDEVGGAAPPDQVGRRLSTEEGGLGGNPPLDGDGGHVGGRLDPEDGDAGGDEVLQQVAVVAGHLDDQAVGPQAEVGDRGGGEPSPVLDPAVGVGREVGVVVEERLRRDHGFQLHQQAAVAHQGVERVAGLVPARGHPVRVQVGVGQGGGAEVDERGRERRLAQPAGGRAHEATRASRL